MVFHTCTKRCEKERAPIYFSITNPLGLLGGHKRALPPYFWGAFPHLQEFLASSPHQLEKGWVKVFKAGNLSPYVFARHSAEGSFILAGVPDTPTE